LSDTTSYNYINLNRTTNKQGDPSRMGGGICIGITKQLTYRDKTDLLPKFLHIETIMI